MAGGGRSAPWGGNESKKTGAHSARARTRGQNPLVERDFFVEYKRFEPRYIRSSFSFALLQNFSSLSVRFYDSAVFAVMSVKNVLYMWNDSVFTEFFSHSQMISI